jgi:hypothetical protein
VPPTLEALFVLSVAIAPGFIGFYVARELSPYPVKKISDWELLLISIAFASVALAGELALYAAVGVVNSGLPVIAGVQPSEISAFGYRDSLQAHTSRVLRIGSTQYVAHCAAIVALGWFDPAGRTFERVRRGRGVSGEDPWIRGLIGLRQEKGHDATYVRATLDSGETYSGYLSKMSIDARDDGTRCRS